MLSSEQFKVCILSAGEGSRNTTYKNMHKALLPLGNKATICRIIESFSEDTKFVIAVGYKKDQIIAYLNNAKPNTDITYVTIDNYNMKGSGPGLSLLNCKDYLQCPFIFLGSDTLVDFEENNHTDLNKNWVGVGSCSKWCNNTGTYCLYDEEKGFYYEHLNKSSKELDNCFIGVAGIKDYKVFWKNLATPKIINNEHQVLSGFSGFDKLSKILFKSWRDTGNNLSYMYVLEEYENIVEPKPDEAIYIEGSKVLKYFDDKMKAFNRVKRSKILQPHVPVAESIDENIYCYDYIPGSRLSDINSVTKISIFFDFIKKMYTLKNVKTNKDFNMKSFLEDCNAMYKLKTLQRINSHKELKYLNDITHINGELVPSIDNLLETIDWNEINNKAVPVKLHGDMSPENIIFDKNSNDFILIDWRDKFGKSLIYGDLYYDLCKLDHALLVNGEIIRNNLYSVSIDHNNLEASIQINQKSNLLEVRCLLENFCIESGLDFKHVELLTAITLLNISSVHTDKKFNRFLFLMGKLMLTKLNWRKK